MFINSMKIYITISLVISALFINSCGPQESIKPFIVSTVRIVIGGYDQTAHPFKDALQRFKHRFPSEHGNHLFFSPKNRAEFSSISNDIAVKHEVLESSLSVDIANIFKNNIKNGVFFVITHGHKDSGQLCYQQPGCALNSGWLASLLRDIDKENQKKDKTQRLERLLIVLSSCYSKRLSEDLKRALGADIKSFSLAVFHLAKDGESCTTFAPDKIFQQLIEFRDSIGLGHSLKKWLEWDDREKRLFGLTTISDLVKFHNELSSGQYQYSVSILNGQEKDFSLDALELRPQALVLSSSAMQEYGTAGGPLTRKEIADIILPSDTLRPRVLYISKIYMGVHNLLNGLGEQPFDWTKSEEFTSTDTFELAIDLQP